MLIADGLAGTSQNGPPGPLAPSKLHPAGLPLLKSALGLAPVVTSDTVKLSIPTPRKPW
jgi:hypothetical protein